LERLTKIAQ